MKHLLYIGNQSTDKKGAVTSLDTLGPLLEQESYSVIYASPKKNRLIRLIHMMWIVFIKRKYADYVLIDTYSTLNFYYAFFVSQWCRILNLKYIPILHGGNLPRRLKNNPYLCELIFKNAYKNVTPSKYIKLAFEKQGYFDLICIPNSLEIDDYPFTPKIFKSIRLLWVRSFSKIYNPKLAIEILKALKDLGMDATLCMIGPDKDGSLNQCKKYAKDLHVDVNFPGKLSKADWIALSKDYNIFINTTNFDNMPVSVMEAMALGFPIISTNVGGMPFLIDNHKDGVLVNSDDANGFVNQIKNIFSNPKNAIMLGNNARKKAESFDWDLIKHQWMSLLK